MVSRKNLYEHRSPFTKGKSYKITVLKDVTVIQANRTSAKTFDLKAGEEFNGTFVFSTIKDECCFNVARFSDEVFFSIDTIKAEENKSS